MKDYTVPNFARAALLTLDVQNDFALPGAVAEIQGTSVCLPAMHLLVNTFRHAARPIVHVVRFYLPDGSNAELCRKAKIESGLKIAVPNTNGAELVAALKPSEAVRANAARLLNGEFQEIASNEWFMFKPRWGAFFKTRLEAHLRERNIDTLVFCGCNFPNCPRTSIYEASARDFRIALAEDALSQLYPKGIEEMRQIGGHVLKTKEICEALRREKY